MVISSRFVIGDLVFHADSKFVGKITAISVNDLGEISCCLNPVGWFSEKTLECYATALYTYVQSLSPELTQDILVGASR